MTSISQKISELSDSDAEQARQKERLVFLMTAARAILHLRRNDVEYQLERLQKRPIHFIEQCHLASKEKFNQQAEKHLNDIVDSSFSINGDKDAKESVQNGIKALISMKIEAFMASVESQEFETKISIMLPEGNALTCADIIIWGYHFKREKITDEADTLVAYMVAKSVDSRNDNMTLDELTHIFGDAEMEKINSTSAPAINAYREELVRVWKKLKERRI